MSQFFSVKHFMPRHDDVSMGIKRFTYLLFSGSSYNSIEFECTDVHDSELDGIQYRFMKINIPIQDFIENSKRKEEILELLKRVISIYEKNCSWLKVVREKEYRFVFTYKGEEI